MNANRTNINNEAAASAANSTDRTACSGGASNGRPGKSSSNKKFNKNSKSRNNSAAGEAKGQIPAGNAKPNDPVGSGASAAAPSHDRNSFARADGLNDPSWYLRYPDLIAAAARAQFMQRPGDYANWEEDGVRGNVRNRFIPSIMRIKYRAAFGTNLTPHDPITIASKGIWDRIRDAYSGTIRVSPPDLFMYMMHCDQFYAFIAWCKRLYGVMNVYSPFNHQMPFELFAAMFPSNNVTLETFNEWKRRRLEFYEFINQMVRMANKYVVPMGMSIYDRHRFMNENVYQDQATDLAQLYVFVPTGFYKVDATGDNGTKLVWTDFTSVNTLDKLMDYGNDFFDRLATWLDAKTMNGYILRAFDGQWYAPVELISMEYTVVPIYSQEVLLQIHNARVMSSFVEDEVTHDPATDVITVAAQRTGYNLDDPLMDVADIVPDPVTFVVASRLTPVEFKKDDVYYVRCGSEVVLGLDIVKPDLNEVGFIKTWSVGNTVMTLSGNMTSGQIENALTYLEAMSALSSFTYHPLIPTGLYIADGSQNPPHVSTFAGEITNCTTIPSVVLAKLHIQCMASELNIYAARNEI